MIFPLIDSELFPSQIWPCESINIDFFLCWSLNQYGRGEITLVHDLEAYTILITLVLKLCCRSFPKSIILSQSLSFWWSWSNLLAHKKHDVWIWWSAAALISSVCLSATAAASWALFSTFSVLCLILVEEKAFISLSSRNASEPSWTKEGRSWSPCSGGRSLDANWHVQKMIQPSSSFEMELLRSSPSVMYPSIS